MKTTTTTMNSLEPRYASRTGRNPHRRRCGSRMCDSLWLSLARMSAAFVAAPCRAQPEGDSQLSPVRVIPLSGVEGRMDHMTLDATGQRLFLAALGNDSVEVV